MEDSEINEIIEEVSRNDFNSYALVRQEDGQLTIRNKNNHFFMIIDDESGEDIIINTLIRLGIEIYPDFPAFETQNPRKPLYPDGFPKDRMK